MGRPVVSRLVLTLVILLLAGSLTPPRVALGQESTPTPATGYTYVVKRGDSWTRISRQTGVPVATLKLNNPQAVHPQDWLYEGERLFIPETSPTPPATPGAADGGYWYQVQPGDSWGSVARSTGATVQELWSANPSQVQPNRWLFIGQWLWIPGPGIPSTPTQIIPTATPSPTATSLPTATSSPTATPSPTVTASPTATLQPTVTPSLTPMPTSTIVSPEVIDAAAHAAATVAAAAESAATVAAAAESAATVVAAANSIATAAAVAQSAATSIAALGTRVAMLASVTTPIVEAPAATPSPAPPFEEPTATAVPTATLPTPTATPQPTATPAPTATQPVPTATQLAPTATQPVSTATRLAPTVTRTPTRTRPATAVATATRVPTRTPAPQIAAACLVDKVIAANQAFDKWGREGFDTAIELYQAVLADTTSKACSKTANELELLRDYARFRLLVSYVGGGQARQAEPLRGQIKDPRLKGAADTFLDGLETSGSIVFSCRLVTQYVEGNPADWRWLTELGLPDKPADLCALG